MRRALFYTTLYFILSLSVNGQSQISELPLSYVYRLNPITDFKQMPRFNTNTFKAEDLQRRAYNYKQKRFAKSFFTDFHPLTSGQWETTPNGGKIWRIGIQSVDAFSLYVVFENYRLEKGASLFVYNADYTQISGPYTSKQNNINNTLPIAPKSGDKIIIELNLAPGIENFGELTLTQVWHDYQNEFGKTHLKSTSDYIAGECNIDINCPLGQSWQKEKQAVCKIVANGELCSGSMINNIKEDNIPYFYTAYHCIESAKSAASAVFYFNFERPFCGSSDNTDAQTIEGSVLMATTPRQIDFALLRLNQFPPISYRPYLAGWDAYSGSTDNSKPAGGICLHHPWGDVKKIAIDLDTLYTGNFGENFNENIYWQIARWDYGVTENGSSGSSLFNTNHRIIGSLTGGSATCGNPVFDYFTKFSAAWNFYPEKNKQLKAWLDPENTGKTFVNGSDPYGFTDANCDTFWNVLPNEENDLTSDTLSWGYISGQNSQNWDAFAEKFNTPDSIQIPAVIFNVAKAGEGDYMSNIRLVIWDGDEYPQNEIYSQLVFMRNLFTEGNSFIYLDSIVQLKGNFFIGYTINYNSPPDTFALYHTVNRLTGPSTFYVQKNSEWKNIKDITQEQYNTSLDIGYIGSKNLNLNYKSFPSITLPTITGKFYPNPCSDHVTIQIKDITEKTTVKCYDISGRSYTLPFDTNFYHITIDVTSLNRGIYAIIVQTDSEKYTGKILIVR